MISIIDYDAGNIKSVEKALEYLGEEAVITSDREIIMNSDGVILPGVGAFGVAMDKIRHRGLDTVIHEYVNLGKPFLGICLGLQLIFEKSDESPDAVGLGLLKGTITKIPEEPSAGEHLKVPQIGWNNIEVNPKSRLLKGLGTNPYVYFVHSYYLKAEDRNDVAATVQYGVSIDAAVEKGNIMATQFHPEKSSDVGLKILTNFIEMTK